MKILVIGSNGQLGSDLVKRIDPKDLEMADMPEFDLTDKAQISELITGVSPDVVINCAAYTDVDKAESDSAAAFAVNSDAVAELARAIQKTSARLIHVSTDYVFDGTLDKERTEQDATSPLGVYGRSKLAGEEAIRDLLSDRGLVVRTSWLHGSSGNNFVKTMIRLFKEKESLKIVDDQVGNPTWSGWLADVLVKLAHKNTSGVLHATCGGIVSWHGFAQEIKDLLQPLESDLIIKSLETQTSSELNRPAPRPAFSALDCSKLEEMLGESRMTWQDGLRWHLAELGYETNKAS